MSTVSTANLKRKHSAEDTSDARDNNANSESPKKVRKMDESKPASSQPETAKSPKPRAPIYVGEFNLFLKERFKQTSADQNPSHQAIYEEIKTTKPKDDGTLTLYYRLSRAQDHENFYDQVVADGYGQDESPGECDGYFNSPVLRDPIVNQRYRVVLLWLLRYGTYGEDDMRTATNVVQLAGSYKHPGVINEGDGSDFHMDRDWAQFGPDGRVCELFTVVLHLSIVLRRDDSPSRSVDQDDTSSESEGDPDLEIDNRYLKDERTFKFWAIRSPSRPEEDLSGDDELDCHDEVEGAPEKPESDEGGEELTEAEIIEIIELRRRYTERTGSMPFDPEVLARLFN